MGDGPRFLIYHRGTEDTEKREGERERLATDAHGRALTIRMEGLGGISPPRRGEKRGECQFK